MNINQIKANFDFVSCHIIEISANCRMPIVSEQNERHFGLDIRCSQPVERDEKKFGKLLLGVDITISNPVEEDKPDTIRVSLVGTFSSPKSVSDEDFLELLNINGGSALYSIARSKVETITAAIYQSGKIVLPMVNIVQFFEERAKQQE